MNIKVDFDNIVVKEDKNDFNVKVLMLKGEKGDAGDGEPNVIEKVQVNGNDLPVTNKTVNVPVPIVDSTLSSSSTNPVQNKVINNALNNKLNPSDLENYYEISEVDNLLNNKANISDVDKIIHYFYNVEEMKSYNLHEGDYAVTKGYYSANDGGHAEYIIKTSSSKFYEELNNGLVAELLDNNIINVKQLGAKGDGETNDSNVLQYAVDNFINKTIYIPEGTYIIDNPIDITNSNVHIKGNGYQKTVLRKYSETTSQLQRTYNNTTFDFGDKPSVINLVFPNGGTISNIEISDLTISVERYDNVRNKYGIYAPYVTFSRFENIRLNRCYTAIYMGGWINKITNVDMLECYPYTVATFDHDYGLIATSFTKCHSNSGGWFLMKCTNAVLNECSADGGDPSFRLNNCKSVTLNSCSTEVTFQCARLTNSYVVINSGDYEVHSSSDDQFVSFFGLYDNSKLILNNPNVRFEDYNEYGNPTEQNIITSTSSLAKGIANITTPFTYRNYVTGTNSIIELNGEVYSNTPKVMNKRQFQIVGGTKVEFLSLPFGYGKNIQASIKGYGYWDHTSIIIDTKISAVCNTGSSDPTKIAINVHDNTNVASKDNVSYTASITAEEDSGNLKFYYTASNGYALTIYLDVEYNNLK